MPSNRTWVCFDCHIATRHHLTVQQIRCSKCGEICFNLGYKIPLPAKADEKAWKSLRQNLRDELAAVADVSHRLKVRRRHDIEKQIASIEARPSSPGRAKLIRDLRKELSE